MKKRIFVMVAALLLITLCGCAQEMNEQTAWETFCAAIQKTSGLEAYAVTYTHTVGEKATATEIILGYDENGVSAAEKTGEAGKMWWYQGLTYDATSGDQQKYAQSLRAFLQISEEGKMPERTDVYDVTGKGEQIAFSLNGEGESDYRVTATLQNGYIRQIQVQTLGKDHEHAESHTYTYQDPGKIPIVTLPQNLADYHY